MYSKLSKNTGIKYIVAMIGGVMAFESAIADVERAEGQRMLEEVMVTARKREESAQDVVGGLQVFSGAELDRLGADGFEDYLLQTPGVSFRNQGNGSKRIALRGVSNIAGGDFVVGDPASTVGLYLNDIALVGTAILPDLALYDLSRVEVLKGPQGTLYGDSSMGGAVKMVLNQPQTDGYEANTDFSVSSTEGGGVNYRTRGMVNIPISDDVALRLVGTYKDNDGFIDNITRGEDNRNDEESYSIRGILAAQLTDNLSGEFLALYDDVYQGDFPQITQSLPDLQTNAAEPRFNESKATILGLTLKYDLGGAELTSVTSHFESERNFLSTVEFIGVTIEAPFYGVPDGIYTEESFFAASTMDAFAQELRLVSNGDNRLDWAVGGYYQKKKFDAGSHVPIPLDEVDAVNAALVANGHVPFPGTVGWSRQVNDEYTHKAVFGEVTYELIPNLDFTVGLRWFDTEINDTDLVLGHGITEPWYIGVPTSQNISGDGYIPKFALSYKLTDDHLVYLEASKGFRSPMFNIQRSSGVGDEGADSDTLWSYTLGAKTAWSDGRVILNGALFYIDWEEIQVVLVDTSPFTGGLVGFVENGGDAVIRGFEIELSALLTDSLQVGVNLGYTHSEMVKAQLNVIEDVVLPNVPEWTVSATAEYRRPIADLGDGFIRFDLQYTDEQATRAITTNVDGLFLDSYAIGTLRVGLDAGDWGVDLFVDNLWDERGEIGRGLASPDSPFNIDRFSITRPRTIGLMFKKNFF